MADAHTARCTGGREIRLHYKVLESQERSWDERALWEHGDWEHSVTLGQGSSFGFLSLKWECGREKGQDEQ